MFTFLNDLTVNRNYSTWRCLFFVQSRFLAVKTTILLILLKPHRFLRCHVIKPIIKTKKNICIQNTALPVNIQQTCTQSKNCKVWPQHDEFNRGQIDVIYSIYKIQAKLNAFWFEKITELKIYLLFLTEKNNSNLSLRNMIPVVAGFYFTQV